MKVTIQHETLGEIVYDENYWTGKKKLLQNGVELPKVDKKTFTTTAGENVTVKGNFLLGASLICGGAETRLTPKITWYEIVLSLLPFVLLLVWGNVVELCLIVPVVGGIIGGVIGGAMWAISLCCMRLVKPVWLKIIIGVVCLGAAFGIGAGIGYAIIGSL